MNLRKRLQLAQVKRWPICTMMREQSVAEHSFNVCMIAYDLATFYPAADPEVFLPKVLAYALSHDMDEVETGDIPSPFKRKLRAECPSVIPVLDGEPKADDQIRALVKLADYLEAVYYLREFGGSRTATTDIYDDIQRNLARYLDEAQLPSPVINHARTLWHSL